MAHTTKRLRDKFPEINELFALKDFLYDLVTQKNNSLKQSIVIFLKTFLRIIKVYLLLMIPVAWFGLMSWGIFVGFRYFLNPLGIENYF